MQEISNAIMAYQDSCTQQPLGIQSQLKNDPALYKLYPNPSSGTFTIESSEKKYELIISNVFGEKIYSSQISLEKPVIDLIIEPSGIYFIQLKTSKGTANKKIIIQK